jgi:hypothetical protein
VKRDVVGQRHVGDVAGRVAGVVEPLGHVEAPGLVVDDDELRPGPHGGDDRPVAGGELGTGDAIGREGEEDLLDGAPPRRDQAGPLETWFGDGRCQARGQPGPALILRGGEGVTIGAPVERRIGNEPAVQIGTGHAESPLVRARWYVPAAGGRRGTVPGVTPQRLRRRNLMADLAKILDTAYENADFADLAAAPVSALQGVSESDAEHLKAAFGIDTIRELATNKFVLWAQAINVLAK